MAHELSTPNIYPLNSTTHDGNEIWSAAVGPATAAGKSGRVIERLMGDVDRLRRDLRLVTAKYEEEQRRSESVREKLESLQDKNANLEVICDTTKTALARRDRRIDDLKVALENETILQKRVEAEKRDISVAAEEARVLHEKVIVQEKELALYATSQYEFLKKAFKDVEVRYNDQFTKLQEDIVGLRRLRQLDQQRFEALDAVCSELRVDQGRLNEVNQRILEVYKDYRKATEEAVGSFAEKAKRDGLVNEEVYQEMKRTIGQMKYIMNVKRDLRD